MWKVALRPWLVSNSCTKIIFFHISACWLWFPSGKHFSQRLHDFRDFTSVWLFNCVFPVSNKPSNLLSVMRYYYNYYYYCCYNLVYISACEITMHGVISLGLRSYYLDIRTQKSAWNQNSLYTTFKGTVADIFPSILHHTGLLVVTWLAGHMTHMHVYIVFFLLYIFMLDFTAS